MITMCLIDNTWHRLLILLKIEGLVYNFFFYYLHIVYTKNHQPNVEISSFTANRILHYYLEKIIESKSLPQETNIHEKMIIFPNRNTVIVGRLFITLIHRQILGTYGGTKGK